MGVGWFILEHPMKMDNDWGHPYFRKPTILLWIEYEYEFHILQFQSEKAVRATAKS